MRRFLKTAICIMSMLIMITGCSSNNNEYVLKINDKPVSKGEFMVYLNEAKTNFESVGGTDIWETDFEGMTAEDVAKNRAVDALELVKISADKAEEFQVSLSDEEKEQAKEQAKTKFDNLGEYAKEAGITLSDVENVMNEQMLYSKVYNKVTDDFEASEADFNAYFETVKSDFMDYYKQYTIKSIFVTDYSKAEEIVSKYNSGTDFDILFDEYEEQEGVKNELQTSYKGTLESFFGLEFDIEAGNITSILEGDGGYYIIKVETISDTSEDEVREIAKGIYTENTKQELFNNEYQKWSENANIEKNEEVFNSIKIK